MRHWINLVENAAPDQMRLHFENGDEDGQLIMEIGGKRVGWFYFDFYHLPEGKVSLHSNIDPTYQNKGYAPRVYDWVEQYLKGKGLKLIPSDRLSDHAYRFWLKRDPTAVADYRRSNNPEGASRAPNLWYSPAGIEKWGEKNTVGITESETHEFTLWHGTSESAEKIAAHGLTSGRLGAVFLTDNPDLAIEYARTDQERTGNPTMTLVSVSVSDLDINLLTGDVDHTSIEDWQESLRETDQCMYRATIPASVLTIEGLSDEDDEGDMYEDIAESADGWITVYHGHQDPVSVSHEMKFFSTSREFAEEYGSVSVYQIRLGTCLDTTDRETVEEFILPLGIEHPMLGIDDEEIPLKTWGDWSDWSSETWEIVEESLDDILAHYPHDVDSVLVTEQGTTNYIVLDPANMRLIEHPVR